jgi:uncharacterized protein YecE (DUF72 family)
MLTYAGTSGFSYKEWKGSFYPKELPDKDMLRYYSSKFPAVEINNTFYRMPAPGTLQKWAEMVPPHFRFVLKAPRRITHTRPLADKGEDVQYLFETAAALDRRLGAVLFQLPPYLHKNVDLLSAFAANLPSAVQVVFEFRHRSWFDEEVYSILRAKQHALCCSDVENQDLRHFVATTDWGYLRLRRPDYSDEELQHWQKRIGAQKWREVFAFFKHEDAGKGPELAGKFLGIP